MTITLQQSTQWVDRVSHTEIWVFVVMVVTLLLVGLVRTLNIAQHRFAIQTAVAKPRTHLEFIDKGVRFNGLAIIQIFISCLVLAFLVFSLSTSVDLWSGFDAWRQYLLLVLGVIVLYVLKYAVYFMIGAVLQSDEITQLSVLTIINMQYAISLLIFPLLMVWYYVPSFPLKHYIQVGLLLVLAGFWLWRLVKVFIVYYNYFPFSKIYLIIYLCALEISPVLVALRYADTVA